MNNLKINSTTKTPEINFDLATGVFSISGVSVPENSVEFYTNVCNWLKDYTKSPHDTTKIVFRLAYVNTSSLQSIYDMLIILDGIHNKPSKIKVDWYYAQDDVDIQEMGEDFRDALNIEFKFFEVESI